MEYESAISQENAEMLSEKYEVEVRVDRNSPTRGKASVHLAFDAESSLTISNILIWEEKGRLNIKMPLVEIGCNKHPAITLQGEIKVAGSGGDNSKIPRESPR